MPEWLLALLVATGVSAVTNLFPVTRHENELKSIRTWKAHLDTKIAILDQIPKQLDTLTTTIKDLDQSIKDIQPGVIDWRLKELEALYRGLHAKVNGNAERLNEIAILRAEVEGIKLRK